MGAISIDENIIIEVINEVIRKYNGAVRQYKNAVNRRIEMQDDGILVHVEITIKIGTSIREVANELIYELSNLFEKQLNLKISNIEVAVMGMISQGRFSKRDILIDWKNGEVKWNE